MLVGFCRGVRTIQLKRRFAGLTRQPAGDRLRRGEALEEIRRVPCILWDRASEKEVARVKKGEGRRDDKGTEAGEREYKEEVEEPGESLQRHL